MSTQEDIPYDLLNVEQALSFVDELINMEESGTQFTPINTTATSEEENTDE